MFNRSKKTWPMYASSGTALLRLNIKGGPMPPLLSKVDANTSSSTNLKTCPYHAPPQKPQIPLV
jgi:hypothetical protein